MVASIPSVRSSLPLTSDLAVRAGNAPPNEAKIVLGEAPAVIASHHSAPVGPLATPLSSLRVETSLAPEPRLPANQRSLNEVARSVDALPALIGRARADLQALKPSIAQTGASNAAEGGADAAARAALSTPKAQAGALGGVRLATTQEYASLLALRDAAKVKPTRAVPPPVVQDAAQSDEAADASAAAGASGAVQRAGPQDATEDHTEAKLLLWDGVSSSVEMVADAYVMYTGMPDSTGALSAEFVGSLVSLAPELVTLFSRLKERRDGEAIGREAGAMIDKVGMLQRKLDAVSDLSSFGDLIQIRGTEAEATSRERAPDRWKHLEDIEAAAPQITGLKDKLARIQSGLALSVTYADRVVGHAREEIKALGLATAGGVVGLAGNAATILGEAGVVGGHAGHVLGGVGAGVMGAAGLLTVPFQAKMMAGAINRARSDERQDRQAGEVLSNPIQGAAKRVERARADETSGVRRGLAKFVQRSSAPRENRFKAFLFGLGITSSVAGATTSGLMVAASAGAVVGGAIATVGLVASGLGILGVALLGGYFIYKAVAKDRSYSKSELQDVVAGKTDTPLMIELKSRQETKVRNQLTAEMIRQSLKHDEPGLQSDANPPLRSLLSRAVEQSNKLDLEGQLESEKAIAEAVQARLKRLNLPETLVPRLTGSLTQDLVGDLAAGVWIDKINHPDLSVDEAIAARFETRVNTQLTALLHEVDKQRTPLQTADAWGRAMVTSLAEDSPARAALLGRLRTELPASDDRIDQLVSVALQRGAGQAGVRALTGLVRESAPEMARLSAMRKLIRRDPEALFYSCVDALQRTDPQSEEHQRLKDDLIAFGVKAETLETATQAQTLEQMVQAAGLLARDIEGR